jgi:hypothetical protein
MKINKTIIDIAISCWKYYWALLFAGIFVSCQSDYTQNETILEAEKLLNASPDSAYSLLSSITNPKQLPKVDYAAWCLNYTNAQYKLQQEIKSDSLILISVNYYKNKDLPKQSGRAYYLLGYVMELQGENKKAMEAYKEAEHRLMPTEENKLKGLVQFNMGYMSMQDEVYQQSLNYFKQSLHYFQQCKEYKYQAYAYREMANMYYQQNMSFDSVMLLSNLALKISLQAGDSANYYSIVARQGEMLYNKDYKRSKGLLLKGYRYFPMQKLHYGAFLAYVYAKLQQSDSAQYYLQPCLSVSNTSNKVLAYSAASLIAKNKTDYKKAFDYLEKSYMLRDSIYQANSNDQLYRIDQQYNSVQKDIETAALKLDNSNKIIWITVLTIAILVVLIILLLISNRNKKKHAIHAIEKQNLEFEMETKHNKYLQKREMLLIKLNNKIDNTLQFNSLNKNLLQQDKKEMFMQEIAKQSILDEYEWLFYINEVNSLFDNRLISLQQKFSELTTLDLIVIALICLKVNITNSCNLLDMTKNTMYVRRKTIKKRLRLDVDVELERWVMNYVTEK